MNKLLVFVCENFAPEFKAVVEQEGFDDVLVKSYPCMCEDKRKINDALRFLNENAEAGADVLVLCSCYCEMVKLVQDMKFVKVIQSNHCFNHHTSEGIIEYIIGKGGYLIGSGWLDHWEKHIKDQGFDRQTAKAFYQSFCTELVFFDMGIHADVEKNLLDLSHFLELPYTRIPTDLNKVKYIIKSAVYEWRLQHQSQESAQELSRTQAQCAEYSAILDLIGKISTYRNKRDTIERIKEIFMLVMGAESFRYTSIDQEESNLSNNGQTIECSEDKTYRLDKGQNKFCIKIDYNGKSFGSIHVGGFLFPQYIEKYLGFAVEIGKICGLVLSNNEQYEKIMESEQKMKYLSSHDSLTGLYNRAHIDHIIADNQNIKKSVVFMFDFDKLKFVNDHYGHAEGDKLLYNFSAILKDSFRETDMVARIGGDEFAAIMYNATPVMAETVKERIKDRMNEYNESLASAHLKLSASIGYAALKYDHATIEEAMKKADEIMYADKMSKQQISF